MGNHTEEINWYEDTDGSEPKKMARTLYTDSEKEGHTADVNDPNKVNYTKKMVQKAKLLIISSGIALLADGQYVFISIHITLMVSLLLTTIIPSAHAGIWNCATV